MKKWIKKLYKFGRKAKLSIIMGLILLIAFLFRISAPTIIGRSSGSLVGTAIGSFRGVTEGISAGTAAGKAAGLSAEDTVAKVKTDLIRTGRLQVLTAGVKIANCHKVGEDYAALYIVKGSAVYTVDLEKAKVDYNSADSSMRIDIPKPQMEVYIDQNETEKLAEYQKHKFVGDAEDGAKAYLNSMKHSEEEIKESMDNYDSLMEQAKTVARNQIEALVDTVRGDHLSVTVHFYDIGKEENNEAS